MRFKAYCAGVAQLAEQRTCNAQVVGSIPIASSNGCMFILYKNILNYLIMPGLAGEVKLTMESSGNRRGR